MKQSSISVISFLILLTVFVLVNADWGACAETVTLSGQITDSDWNPVAGVLVEARDPSAWGELRVDWTSYDGTYSISVAAGTYTLFIRPPDGSGLSQHRIDGLQLTQDTMLDVTLETEKPGVGRIPSKGSIKALSIFVKFPGEFGDMTSAPPYSEDIFNIDLPGNFSHFYDEMSCGQLKIEGEVLPKLYVSDHPADYYMDKYLPYGQVVKEILEKVDSDIDFSRFDSDGPDGIANSGDDDGYVDVVFVNFLKIPSGFILFGEALGIADLGLGGVDFISSDTGNSGDNIRVKLGTVLESSSFEMLIGAMSHEFGHLLGLGELYNPGYLVPLDTPPEKDSAGIGSWGIMGHGAWGWNGNDGPNPFCAFSLEKLGWIGVDNERLEVVTESQSISALPLFDGGKVYKVPLPDKGYYLISNRDASASYYDRNIPGNGLLIWHVTRNAHSFRSIDLECADGRYRDAGYPLGKEPDPLYGEDNLDFWSHDESYRISRAGNTGDSTDPFDGEVFTSFSEDRNPRSLSIELAEIHRENGAVSAELIIPQCFEVFEYSVQRYDPLQGWLLLGSPPNPGDLLRLNFSVANWTDFVLTSLSVTLSTDDSFVNLGLGLGPVSFDFGEVLPREVKSLSSETLGSTEFVVSSDAPSDHDIAFDFSMSSDGHEWTDSVVLFTFGGDITPPDIVDYWLSRRIGDSIEIVCSVWSSPK